MAALTTFPTRWFASFVVKERFGLSAWPVLLGLGAQYVLSVQYRQEPKVHFLAGIAVLFPGGNKKPGAGPGSFRRWKGMNYARERKLAAFKRNIGRERRKAATEALHAETAAIITAQYYAMNRAAQCTTLSDHPKRQTPPE